LNEKPHDLLKPYRVPSVLLLAQDIQLRLQTLPPPQSLPSYLIHIQNPLLLPQLSNLLTLLNQALDIIDISTWTGDPQNGSFIAGQLKLLSDTMKEARQTLKGGEDVVGGKWWDDEYDDSVCSLPLYPNWRIHTAHLDVLSTTSANTINTSCHL